MNRFKLKNKSNVMIGFVITFLVINYSFADTRVSSSEVVTAITGLDSVNTVELPSEVVTVAKEIPSIEIVSTKTYSAKEIVVTFQNELLEVMKRGKELGFQGRYQQLEKAITHSHDLAKIARIVMGKEWKNLSATQRLELTDVFTRLSISAYAYNFKEFSNESFKFISKDETARGGIIIHTVFVLPKEKDVKFDYMLKKKTNNWRIINIIANGVSDLALKRSEYTSILKREGFKMLVAKISEKIDNYAQNK